MVAILIVNRKLINPGGKKIIKMERFLNQNVLLKKKNKQNYEQNNDNDCHENDYTDFDINKRSTNIGHNIKRRRRPSLVKSLYPETDAFRSYTCNIQIGKQNSV